MTTDTSALWPELNVLAERWGAESARHDHGPTAGASMRAIMEYVGLRLSRLPDSHHAARLRELGDMRSADVAAAYRAGYLGAPHPEGA